MTGMARLSYAMWALWRGTIFSLMAVLLIPSLLLAEGTRAIIIKPKKPALATPMNYTGHYALLIGVNDYDQRTGWSDLNSIPGELDSLQKVLTESGFHVTRVSNPDKKQLESAFSDFIDKYGYEKNNRLFFYFAGHGHSMKMGSKTRGFLVPKDAPSPKDQAAFMRKTLQMRRIISWSEEMTAKHALFLFDSCFSGTVLASRAFPGEPPHISKMTAYPVRQYLTSGSEGETVPAQSTFAKFVVRGLQGEADTNKDNYILGTELGLYIKEKLAYYEVGTTPQIGKIRNPDLDRGEFVIRVPGRKVPASLPGAGSGSGIGAGTVAVVVTPKAPVPLEQQQPRIGASYTNAIGMKLMYIPAGKFMMGSPVSEKGRGKDETLHLVHMASAFYMGATEVTQAQWQQVMGGNPSKFKGDALPVERVSWTDAITFCRKLSQLEGKTYTLPTEVQWEYACRAGSTGAYAGALDEMGWYGANANAKTQAVGTKQPNRWGLYDMHGNVWEWCIDRYGPYPSRPVTSTVLSGAQPGAKDMLVSRGGSFRYTANECRSAHRSQSRNGAGSDMGFRVVLKSALPIRPVLPAPVQQKLPSRIGESFTNTIGMKLMYIPATTSSEWKQISGGKDTFLRGSPASEQGRDADETQHRVRLTRSFCMASTEVTQGQWRAVMKTNRSVFQGDDQLPVENVSWHDAAEFCQKLSALEGKTYTLPTEAEWEYACRAGTTTIFHTGNSISPAQANYAGNFPYGDTPEGVDLGKTAPVGSYPPNAWGLYDMHGNVWEWCSDWFQETYASETLTDPKGPLTAQTSRVYRGGSWDYGAKLVRSANRTKHPPKFKFDGLGFRVVLRLQVKPSSPVSVIVPKPQLSPPSKSKPKIGDSVANTIGMKLMYIPAGEFMMGSPAEKQPRVRLTKSFYMSSTEVTQGQWQKMMGNNPSHFKGDNLPVEKVSWDDAAAFCKKLSQKEGKTCTLPTEAEWEYACRAGTTGPYAGSLDAMGWYFYNSGEKTHAVGTKKANAWGLYDMHGNVWEWCSDWYGNYPSGIVTDPKGRASPSERVYRGGSWGCFARRCQSAYRSSSFPDMGDLELGFRVVLRSEVVPQAEKTDAVSKPVVTPKTQPKPGAPKAGTSVTNSIFD